jgi:hypothetical protein
MSRSFLSLSRIASVAALALLVGCAGGRVQTATARVDVLTTGFLVDNTVLATPEELRAFLKDMNARDVTLYATKDINADRIGRAATAVRDSGATVEIVMTPAPPPAAR